MGCMAGYCRKATTIDYFVKRNLKLSKRKYSNEREQRILRIYKLQAGRRK